MIDWMLFRKSSQFPGKAHMKRPQRRGVYRMAIKPAQIYALQEERTKSMLRPYINVTGGLWTHSESQHSRVTFNLSLNFACTRFCNQNAMK